MSDIELRPIFLVSDWIYKFSVKERSELVLLTIANVWPSFDKHGDIDEGVKAWVDIVSSLSKQQEIAQILSFCSALEFFALRDRGSSEGWDHLVTVNESVRDALLIKGHDENFVQPLSDALQEIPLRKKRWLLQTTAWRQLRKGPLSDAAMLSWLTATDRSWLLIS